MPRLRNPMKTPVCKWFSVCPMKRFNERGLVADAVIAAYCKGNWANCVRYQKEEAGIYHSDALLPDGTLDEKLARDG